jgi:hypothetical protein
MPPSTGTRRNDLLLMARGFRISDAGELGETPVAYAGGRLYGGAIGNGFTNGEIYSLTPPASGGGAWAEHVVYSFTGGSDGGGPVAKLVASADGVLYGTTYSGGAFGRGTALSLTPPDAPGAPSALTTIYDFHPERRQNGRYLNAGP